METRHRRYLCPPHSSDRERKNYLADPCSRKEGAQFSRRIGEASAEIDDPGERVYFSFASPLSLSTLQGQYNRSINRRFPIILPLHASNLRLFLRKTALESNFFSPFFCILYAVTKNRRIVSVSANSRVFKFNFKTHLDTLVRAVVIS